VKHYRYLATDHLATDLDFVLQGFQKCKLLRIPLCVSKAFLVTSTPWLNQSNKAGHDVHLFVHMSVYPSVCQQKFFLVQIALAV